MCRHRNCAYFKSLEDLEEKSGVKERFLDLFSLLSAFCTGYSTTLGTYMVTSYDIPYFDFHIEGDAKVLRLQSPTGEHGHTVFQEGKSSPMDLNMSRIEELVATGETHAAIVGVGISIVMLLGVLCFPANSSSLEDNKLANDSNSNSYSELYADQALHDRSDLESELQLTIRTPMEDSMKSSSNLHRWQRLNHLLDIYERSLRGNISTLIDIGLGERFLLVQIWRSIGEGFIWPSRVLLGKALNRFPGAAFATSRGRLSLSSK